MHRWDPYTYVERRDDVTVAWEPLPRTTGGAICIRCLDGHSILVVDPALAGPDRRDALAHELVHHERGGGAAGAGNPRFAPDRHREEIRVRRIVAARLVPTYELQRFCDRQADLGHGVGPAEVMDEFEVSWHVACDALDNLTDMERDQARSADAAA